MGDITKVESGIGRNPKKQSCLNLRAKSNGEIESVVEQQFRPVAAHSLQFCNHLGDRITQAKRV